MERANFLFVSLDGLIGDIAWQVVKEGHNVKYYRTDIGDRWYEDSDRLNTWGYLREV